MNVSVVIATIGTVIITTIMIYSIADPQAYGQYGPPGYVEQSSYMGDCINKPAGTTCIRYSDGYIWLVKDSSMKLRFDVGSWTVMNKVELAIGGKSLYYHILETSFVKEVTKTLGGPVAFDRFAIHLLPSPTSTILLTANDPENESLKFSIITGPSLGVIKLVQTSSNTANVTYFYNPGVTYLDGKPVPNRGSPDNFTFKVSDGRLDSNIATVTISQLRIVSAFLEVFTDKQKYHFGDNVEVFANSPARENVTLTITVKDGSDRDYTYLELSPKVSGRYSGTFKVTGERGPGIYTVSAGRLGQEATTAFELLSSNGTTPPSATEIQLVAKQIRDIILVRIKNMPDSGSTVYGLDLVANDGMIRTAKGKLDWSAVDVLQGSVGFSSSHGLEPGEKTYLLLKIGGKPTFSWEVFDDSGELLASGRLRPIIIN